jgi:hypothetical protein
MGESSDSYRVDILFSCWEGEARSFVDCNVRSASRGFHHWSFFHILSIIEERFLNSKSSKIAQLKVEALQQGSLSLAEYIDKMTFWHSFLPMPSSDYDVRVRFCSGLRSDIWDTMSNCGFTFFHYSLSRLINEARRIEDSIEAEKAAQAVRLSHRARSVVRSEVGGERFRPNRSRNRRPFSQTRYHSVRYRSGRYSRSPSEYSRSPNVRCDQDDRNPDKRNDRSPSPKRPSRSDGKRSDKAPLKDKGSSPKHYSRSLSRDRPDDGTCWDCGSDSHFKWDCPRLPDRDDHQRRPRSLTRSDRGPATPSARSVPDRSPVSTGDGFHPEPESESFYGRKIQSPGPSSRRLSHLTDISDSDVKSDVDTGIFARSVRIVDQDVSSKLVCGKTSLAASTWRTSLKIDRPDRPKEQ